MKILRNTNPNEPAKMASNNCQSLIFVFDWAIMFSRRVMPPNLKQCIRRAADGSFGLEPGQMNYDQRPLRKGRRGGYTAVGLSRFAGRAQAYRRK